MKGLMERASAGNRQAVTELYEKHWKGVTAICTGSLGTTDAAYAAVVQAYHNTWSYLLNHCMKTEEDFKTTLYKQAAMLCRKNFMKKGMKGLPIPQGRNFLAAKFQDAYAADVSALDNFLEMLPGLNRYLFVLHRVAGFDERMIASITGYKKDVVKAALTAEMQNTAKALEQLDKSAGRTVDLEKEILCYQEETDLPEKYQQQILAGIDANIKPYEKKRMARTAAYTACAVGLVFLIGIFLAAYNKKEPEITFSEKESVSQGDGVSAESEAGEETETPEDGQTEGGGTALSDGHTYYADMEIEGYGTITMELSYDAAPATVENFVKLAEEGFYDGLTFHRIKDGFVMQGGDPNGDGTGGAEETIVGEFSANGYENDLSHTRGVVSMARSNEYDSASSQFFIVHEDSTFLDGQYAAFGWVTEGMDIVDAICTEAEPTDDNGTIPAEQQPIITSVKIRTDSAEASAD